MSWIVEAINMAIERIELAGIGLDIKINSYTSLPPELQGLVNHQQARLNS